MKDRFRQLDKEIRRLGYELAVAWTKGRASFVLDSLSRERPLQAALVASLVYEQLARWDPYDTKYPKSFWRALLVRSQGSITPEEVAELEGLYRRRFGSSPPRFAGSSPRASDPYESSSMEGRARQIGQALADGAPILPKRSEGSRSTGFLRRQEELR